MSRFKHLFGLLSFLTVLVGCASHPPMPTVQTVDLERFMGDWYVIASIPTVFERDIYNAVERYDQVGTERIQTTFTFLKGGFDGKRKTMKPVGFVHDDGSNAVWGMQFVWPIKADYRIVYLDDDYQHTIIGRQKRDYVWIMSRQPEMSAETYDQLQKHVRDLGYNTDNLVRVPQKWD